MVNIEKNVSCYYYYLCIQNQFQPYKNHLKTLFLKISTCFSFLTLIPSHHIIPHLNSNTHNPLFISLGICIFIENKYWVLTVCLQR